MDKIKKGFILFIVGLMVVTLLGGCGGGRSVGDQVSQINITYVKAPLNVPSIVQKRLEMFEQEFGKDGIEVSFPEITAGPQQTQALAAGQLDFLNAVGGTSVILAAANGVDMKIISVYSRAPKAFMILTKSSDIQGPADLKGKKVGGPKGTVLHQLLVTALVSNDLKADDVEFIAMDISSAVAALNNGSIDAALVAGPAALQAINSGATIVTTGEGLVEGTIVVAVSGDFLQKHPDLVKRFAKVQQESLQFMRDNPEEAYRLTAEETGLSIEDVKEMYAWYDFNPEIKPSDIEELKITQEFLLNNDMLTKPLVIEDLIPSIK